MGEGSQDLLKDAGLSCFDEQFAVYHSFPHTAEDFLSSDIPNHTRRSDIYTMGLGTKIKEVLHGDHRDHTTSDVKAPGAYPDEELSSRHSDGREYNSTHGSLANKRDTSDSAGKSDLGSVGL